MKKANWSIACLLVLAVLVVRPHAQGPVNKSHEQWLRDAYKEATSIRVGMNRGDLEKVFDIDGGLNAIPATRYVLKSCSMIKVDVDFDPKPGPAENGVPDKELKIIKVSKPYLEYMNLD